MSLWQEDQLNTAELGRRAGLEPSTVTGLLDRMEGDGLINRQANPADRRVQCICLTSAAMQIQQPLLSVVSNTLEKITKGISEEDLESTKRTLQKFLSNTKEEKLGS